MVKKNNSFIIIFLLLFLLQAINSKLELLENKVGEINGYLYQLWKSDNIGLTTMTIENPNQFSCSWTTVDSVVFLLGKKMKYDLLDHDPNDITINYDLEFKPNGFSYISINGYFGAEYEEFNIVENYNDNWSMSLKKSLGTVSIDDGTYDIYYNEVIYPPNIHGIQKKIEYWSVRKEKRSNGTVSFGKHYEAWKLKGLTFDKITGVYMKVEGYQSSGTADINNFELNIKED